VTTRGAAPLRGRLIAVEGIDGCGKSVQASHLASALGALCTFEPGATALGAVLRRLVLSTDGPSSVERAEALLLAADRAQHVAEVIEPALASGSWVVTDRYNGSTLAYQGWGRGLAVEGLRELTSWAAGGVEADLSVLIDVPVGVARERLESTRPDRLEALDPDFHQRVRDGFLALADTDRAGWVVVDGSPGIDRVAMAVLTSVTDRVGRP
jgi:dTMP kinase